MSLAFDKMRSWSVLKFLTSTITSASLPCMRSPRVLNSAFTPAAFISALPTMFANLLKSFRLF